MRFVIFFYSVQSSVPDSSRMTPQNSTVELLHFPSRKVHLSNMTSAPAIAVYTAVISDKYIFFYVERVKVSP